MSGNEEESFNDENNSSSSSGISIEYVVSWKYQNRVKGIRGTRTYTFRGIA